VLASCYFTLYEEQELPLPAVLGILCVNFVGFEFAYSNAVSASLDLAPSIRATPIGNAMRVVVSLARIGGAIAGALLWSMHDFSGLVIALCGCYGLSAMIVTIMAFYKQKSGDFEEIE
jgi:hypothetical protein